MTKKTFKIYADTAKQIIPVYLSDDNFTESDSKSAIFGSNIDFYHGTSGSSIVANYDFETVVSDWASDWSRSVPVSNWSIENPMYDGEADIKAIATIFDTSNAQSNTITSASFAVNSAYTYDFSIDLFSKDGRLINTINSTDKPTQPVIEPTEFYYNQYPNVLYEQQNDTNLAIFPLIYGVKVLWYVNGIPYSAMPTETLKSGFGTTAYASDWYVLPYESNIEYDTSQSQKTDSGGMSAVEKYVPPQGEWIKWEASTKPPATVNGAKIQIYAYINRINTPWEVVRYPSFKVDNVVYAQSTGTYITTAISDSESGSVIYFNDSPNFEATYAGSDSSVPLAAGVSGSDCSSGTDGYFSLTAPSLYFGKTAASKTFRTWIPFKPNFPTGGGGIKIKSAYLSLTSAISSPVIGGQPTKLKISFDKKLNPSYPTSATDLNSRQTIAAVADIVVTNPVEPGKTYNFDITTVAKAYFGTNSIVWTPGNKCAIIISDGGSYAGTANLKQVASSHSTNYNPPTITIETTTVSYPYDVLDTHISASAVTSSIQNVNYNSSNYLYVGKSSDGITRRSLIRFDTSSIPSNAVITNAKLRIWKATSPGNPSSGTMHAYKISEFKPWDLITATWNRRTGLDGWSGGGLVSGDDYEATSSGNVVISGSTVATDYSDIILNNATVQAWVTNSSKNNGLLLKMISETVNNQFAFISSNVNSRTPQLVVSYTINGTTQTPKTIQTLGTGVVIDPVPEPDPDDPPVDPPVEPDPVDPPVDPPVDQYTKSLLHFDSSPIIDAVGGITWTPTIASISTTTKKFGTGSLNLTKPGATIRRPSWTTDYDLAYKNFTIDFWVNFQGTPLYNDTNDSNGLRSIWSVRKGNLWSTIFFDGRTGWSDRWNLHFSYRATEGSDNAVDGGWKLSFPPTSGLLTTSRWYHVAFVREGHKGRAFLDGKLVTDKYYLKLIDLHTDSGYSVFMGSPSTSLKGSRCYVDEFRFSPGIARWASTFPKPTEPPA